VLFRLYLYSVRVKEGDLVYDRLMVDLAVGDSLFQTFLVESFLLGEDSSSSIGMA
jgi:hypothetical protein